MSKTTSIELELRGLWSICDSEDPVKAKILGVLQGEHFACPETSELYRRVIGLASNNKKIPRIQTLRQDPTLSTEAQEILAIEKEPCLTESDAEALVDQLEQFRKLRVIYDGALELTKSVKDPRPETIELALSCMERTIQRARSSYEDSKVAILGRGYNAQDIVDRVLSDEKPDRILTGFSKFDEASGGFARKDLVLIAAATSAGKSVMAEQLAINMFLKTGQNRSVAIVSFEMDDDEIGARLISNLTGYDFGKVYLKRLDYRQRAKGREVWDQFVHHGEVHGNQFAIWGPTMDVTPAQIGAFLRPGRYDAVFIDYVGLVAPEQKAAMWENLGDITRGFKAVARQNDCVVIVMAQLDEETNKVKYSKAMRHHSSYVWKWTYGEEQEDSGRILVEQEKARHCRRFSFPLVVNFSNMSFLDAPEEFNRQDISAKEENQVHKVRRQPLHEDSGPVPADAVRQMLDDFKAKAIEPKATVDPKPSEPRSVVEIKVAPVVAPEQIVYSSETQEEKISREIMVLRMRNRLGGIGGGISSEEDE